MPAEAALNRGGRGSVRWPAAARLAAGAGPLPDDRDVPRLGSGTERPEALPPDEAPPLVDRTFAFVDLAGFTAFTDRYGVHAAVEKLATFRDLTRDVANRRGVRVAKWLGDGAMLVSVRPGPAVATCAELLGRFAPTGLRVRAGIAGGPVLLFHGDDYVGGPVNLAARLASLAEAGQILAAASTASAAPDWIVVAGRRDVDVRGIGVVDGVCQLDLADDVNLPARGR